MISKQTVLLLAEAHSGFEKARVRIRGSVGGAPEQFCLYDNQLCLRFCTIYFGPGWGARYCDECVYMSVCLCVCLLAYLKDRV